MKAAVILGLGLLGWFAFVISQWSDYGDTLAYSCGYLIGQRRGINAAGPTPIEFGAPPPHCEIIQKRATEQGFTP